MVKHHFKLILLLIIFVAAIGAIFAGTDVKKPKPVVSKATAPITEPAFPEITSQESPDGKEILTIRKLTNAGNTTYTVSSSSGIDFTKQLPKNITMSIPFNTWSTDGKTVFVKEDLGSTVNWYVYPENINVTDYFNQKLPNYKLTEITGWAADNLLILNTNKADGTEGFSYWFDTGSHNFVQLSQRFN